MSPIVSCNSNAVWRRVPGEISPPLQRGRSQRAKKGQAHKKNGVFSPRNTRKPRKFVWSVSPCLCPSRCSRFMLLTGVSAINLTAESFYCLFLLVRVFRGSWNLKRSVPCRRQAPFMEGEAGVGGIVRTSPAPGEAFCSLPRSTQETRVFQSGRC